MEPDQLITQNFSLSFLISRLWIRTMMAFSNLENVPLSEESGSGTTLIPVRIRPSSWFSPIPDHDMLYLPLDIAPGDTKTVMGRIWAEINRPPHVPSDGSALQAKSTIQLEAVIPDLDRKIPNFHHSQEIIIQYPVQLVHDSFKWMDSIPWGCTTSIKWRVSGTWTLKGL